MIGAYALDVGEITETKLIVVPEADGHTAHLHDLSDLTQTFLDELNAFSPRTGCGPAPQSVKR